MAEQTMTITVRGEGMTLALLIWRHMKRQPEGYLERVLVANPGLADAGAFLPVGTRIVLPLDLPSVESEADRVVTLWD